MMQQPHPDKTGMIVTCAVITVSDTRSPETDRSGQLIKQQFSMPVCAMGAYTIVKDEPAQIQAQMRAESALGSGCCVNGGTGIAPRDTTYDAIELCWKKSCRIWGVVSLAELSRNWFTSDRVSCDRWCLSR